MSLKSDKKTKIKPMEHLLYAILAALFAAIITVSIMYIFHIPFGNGYFHIGDAFIFLAGAFLPTPYAVLAAAIGGGLADLLSPGAAIWAPATIIIKSLVVLLFTNKDKKFINVHNIVAILFAAVITCAGYYVYEGLIYHNWAAAVPGLGMNLAQVIISGVVFVVLGLAFDGVKLKTKLNKKFH